MLLGGLLKRIFYHNLVENFLKNKMAANYHLKELFVWRARHRLIGSTSFLKEFLSGMAEIFLWKSCLVMSPLQGLVSYQKRNSTHQSQGLNCTKVMIQCWTIWSFRKYQGTASDKCTSCTRHRRHQHRKLSLKSCLPRKNCPKTWLRRFLRNDRSATGWTVSYDTSVIFYLTL